MQPPTQARAARSLTCKCTPVLANNYRRSRRLERLHTRLATLYQERYRRDRGHADKEHTKDVRARAPQRQHQQNSLLRALLGLVPRLRGRGPAGTSCWRCARPRGRRRSACPARARPLALARHERRGHRLAHVRLILRVCLLVLFLIIARHALALLAPPAIAMRVPVPAVRVPVPAARVAVPVLLLILIVVLIVVLVLRRRNNRRIQ